MGMFGLFGKKKKPVKAKARAKPQAKQKLEVKKEVSIATTDEKYGQIMKEFGVLQKELKDIRQALGLLKQAEERTYSEIQDHPGKLSAVIEREIADLSKKLDDMVLGGKPETGLPTNGAAADGIPVKVTGLMTQVLDALEDGVLTSGEIYGQLQEKGIKVHEKSIPRALRKLIDHGLVKITPSGGTNLYEKQN
jgi:transposase